MLNRDFLTIEEYENKEFTKNHYSREERLKSKRNHDGDSSYEGSWSFFSFLKSKKKRRTLSFIHLGLLLIATVIFFAYDSINSYLFSGWNEPYSGIKVKMSLLNMNDNSTSNHGLILYLFITNELEENQTLTMDSVPSLIFIKGKKVVFKKELNIPKKVRIGYKDSVLKEHNNNTYSYTEEIILNRDLDYDKVRLKMVLQGSKNIIIEKNKIKEME
jgi:hypothetical protein